MSDRANTQKLVMIGAGAAIAVAVGALFLALDNGRPSGPVVTEATDIRSEVLSGITGSAREEELWVRRSEARLRQMSQEIERLQSTNEALKAQVAANVKDEKAIVEEIGQSINAALTGLATRVQSAEARATAAEAEIVRLNASLETVREEQAELAAAPSELPRPASFSPGQGENEFVRANPDPVAAPGRPAPSATPAPARAPASIEFQLEGNKDTRRRIDRYLPAGSYASAVVLSGVDASAGVQNASDPRPVLLRVTGPAITAAAAGGRPQEIDITGCIITAEAVGDLSSERVFPRLISMTCSPEDEVVTEMQVAGFVAGQGKAGVRGQVVSREGDLVESAAIAGVLSGFAGVVSDIGSTATGDVTSDDTLQGLDTILGRGVIDAGGQGAGQALDRLADYYIQRAEQYQPVISLYGGTLVEVVFLKGVSIDG